MRIASEWEFAYPPELLTEVNDARFEIDTGWSRPSTLWRSSLQEEFGYPPELTPRGDRRSDTP